MEKLQVVGRLIHLQQNCACGIEHETSKVCKICNTKVLQIATFDNVESHEIIKDFVQNLDGSTHSTI